MGSKELLSVDFVKGVIEENFNRYFRCMDIVNCIVAVRNGVSLMFVMRCKKRDHDPYENGRTHLRGQVTWVLKGLEKDGYIEKYNKKTWMVVV